MKLLSRHKILNSNWPPDFNYPWALTIENLICESIEFRINSKLDIIYYLCKYLRVWS